MTLDLSGVSKFLKGLDFLDGFGLVATGIGMVDLVLGYALEDWTEEPTNTEVLEQIDLLSEQLDTLAPAIIEAVNDLVNDQAIGIRMQQLASALSGIQSTRDLLSSYQPGDDLMRTEIIVEASGAFRDTLAQATAIITPSTAYTPTYIAVNTALASVMQAMTTRLSVAAILESDEISANKIRTQLLDAADFFENMVDVYRNTIETRVATREVVDVNGHPRYLYIVELDIDRGFTDGGTDGGQVPIPPFRVDVTLADANTQRVFARLEGELENLALEEMGMGLGGQNLLSMAARYRALADGVEVSLPQRIGYDSSGTLIGSAGNDLLIGNIGDDKLKGLADNDLLRGAAGNDKLFGGDGDDKLIGGTGNDILRGGAGSDALEGGAGDDAIYGDSGMTIYSGSGASAIYMADDIGHDQARFHGNIESYTIKFTGITKINTVTLVPNGNASPTEVFGSAYQSVMTVTGPDGADIMVGVETLIFDNDRFLVLHSTDVADTVTGEASNDFIFGYGGNDSLLGMNGNDVLFGGSGHDTIQGGNGRDTLNGEAGNDALFGGNGRDRLIGNTGADSLYGQAGNDRLFGGNGNDALWGDAGADRLVGGAGADYINGGLGNDLLIGGFGADDFRFDVNFGADTITDYDIGTDELVLDEALWFFTHGQLTAAQVVATFGSTDGTDTVLAINGGTSITLLGISDLSGLATDIFIDPFVI